MTAARGRNGGAPTANSARARQAELGVLEWFAVGEHLRAERVVSHLRQLGVRHLRTGISWAEWHTPGGARWYDWLLPRLAEELELLPCVLYTPPSLAVAPRPSAPPRRPRDYADFVDVLIDRYGELFEHIELWNEPNNLMEWDWTLDPLWLAFAEMVGSAAYWARERGKRTVLGGMSPVDPNWLRMMGERGVLEHVDVAGIHGFPGMSDRGWPGWGAAAESLRPVLDEFASDAEVWITEAGFSTWRNDELRQARAFLEAARAPVARMYWYGAEDLHPDRASFGGFHTDERDYHFGLRAADGRPKLLARLWAAGGLAAVRELELLSTGPRRAACGHALVLGGAGFIGSNVTERLLAHGEKVLVFDNLSRPGVEQNLRALRSRHDSRLAIEVADVRDRLALRTALDGATSVFDFAAQVAVTTSIVDPIADFEVNLQGTVGLVEELRRLADPPPLLFTSTNKVYGCLPDLELRRTPSRWEPVDPSIRRFGLGEDVPLDFATPYGCSKGGADQYVLDAAKTFGLPTVVFRMSCIYGPYQHGNEDQGWVAHFLLRALAGESITLYGDGAQVRDVLYVDDLVDAFLAARAEVGTLAGTPFNLGGGPRNTISLIELVELIEDLHGERPELAFAPERPGDQRYYVADVRRFGRATGWQPTVAVADGVERLYRWLAVGPHSTTALPVRRQRLRVVAR